MAGKIVNNYGRLPVVFVSGNGAMLTDDKGKRYIDFVAGIGVNCLGHGHPALVRAVQTQSAKVLHVSNYYNSDKGLAFADALLEASGMERVYFGNSGAEANEAAIKLARKYGWLATEAAKKARGAAGVLAQNEVVTLENSFHGRTLAALAATGQDAFHPPCFAPYPAGFRTIPANDFAALDAAFDETTCALMLECVQGEGGVNLLDARWAQAAAAAARKAGALVIADEVQTGIGRTGYLFASEELGIEPDVITASKGIAGGIPMGACLFRGTARDAFAAGDHQSTFAGNPLAAAAGLAVLAELTKPGFLARVRAAGERIRSEIAGWRLNMLRDIRGKGLMLGIDFSVDSGANKGVDAAAIQRKCLDAGLCITTAGTHTLRFLPPLVITDAEIDAGLKILKTILQSVQ
ncbi:acetylornithine transaminase [Treponema endosymbiont of Eucomonympha sp.]|uniref:acetylornithine transaminase n=1 Tax=Treponema endosymbiont of Eucomonympha sp. TaxID=1580831 RepID=UPI0007832522|nr:acetylornithine transaminase [Treponema endosymbiont of Eucomonympha sp.]